MFENDTVDDRNVECRKDDHESSNDSLEEELNVLDIMYLLRKVLLTVGLHAEEGAAHINQLPSQESAKHIRHTKVVARARKTVSHSAL